MWKNCYHVARTYTSLKASKVLVLKEISSAGAKNKCIIVAKYFHISNKFWKEKTKQHS